MAAPLSSLSSIPQWIHSRLYTNGLLSPLIVYAWLRPEFVMVAVRYLVLIGEGTFLTPAFFPLGKPSDVYSKCLQEVQTISCATLFAPVLRVEAVQAMSV